MRVRARVTLSCLDEQNRRGSPVKPELPLSISSMKKCRKESAVELSIDNSQLTISNYRVALTGALSTLKMRAS